jgi:uracil-DNA glycosylase
MEFKSYTVGDTLLSDKSSMAAAASLARLHREIQGCTRCVDEGYLPLAAPVLSGYADNRIMLIGQAPGAVEAERRLPFQGRSRKVLISWLMRAGVASEEQARRRIYMTSITKCFPGKSLGGDGDRRPSRAEVALCGDHLDRQLRLLKPSVIILVGGLAHDRFLPGRSLESLVGRVFDEHGAAVSSRAPVSPLLVPLPHPSGASRWLNAPEHRALLERALRRLRPLLRPLLDQPQVGAYTSPQHAGAGRPR